MADFVAVIRKAVDNLPDNTPENRSKVYDKARAAIRRQLEAINPPPSDEVIARQLDKLGQAIDEVESDHAEAQPADIDETEALMAELESMVEKSPVIAEAVPEPQPEAPKPAPKPAPVAAKPVAPVYHEPVMAPEQVPEPAPVTASVHQAMDEHEPEAVSGPGDLLGDAHDEAFGLDHAPRRETHTPPRKVAAGKGGKGGVLALVLILGFVGLVAFAGWTYKDTITAMLGTSPVDTPVATEDAGATAETADVTPPATEEPAPIETAMTEEVSPADDAKFTQRLNADGTEIDEGPAAGPDADDTLEGRSVAELTDAGPADESVAEETTAEAAVSPGAEPLGVAQKMILYEERLGQQSLEVKSGTVVWTLVSEQSGDGPDEQVIRGEINNADKGLSALLTIKRNTDASLPASHIIEIVFALPADFDGGSIDQLQRIALKQTEADQGTPLIAVPAKITQDFYMVALNDLEEARKANIDLLRQRNWIDIPVVYANGRQALITLEKGASGTEVFNQALDAWARATPQN